MTVLLVTHLMEEAERLADRVAVFGEGRVIAIDTPGRHRRQGRPGAAAAVPAIGADRRPAAHRPAGGPARRADGTDVVVTGTGNLMPAVTSVLARHQVVANDLRIEQANLDDAFSPSPAGGPHRQGAVMNEMRALIVTEARLLFREPITWLAAIVLPTAILLIFGSMFGPPEPDPAFGGLRFIDVFVPSLVVITVGTLGIQTLPIRLATYREKGVLRRLSTTPAHPLRLLSRSWSIYMVTAVIALVLLVVVGQRRVRRAAARASRSATSPRSLLGMASLFAIGLLLAAVAPSSRVATAVAIPMFFAVMFLGGVYLPRVFLPDILVRIGEFTPPGVQGLQDAWLGTAPQLAAARRDGARSPSSAGRVAVRRVPVGVTAVPDGAHGAVE